MLIRVTSACACVYIYHGIGENLIESIRCECSGAFIHYTIDTVCAFYSISPSTARLACSHLWKFVYFFRCTAEEMSISCRVFESKSNATNRVTAINQRLQFEEWKRERKQMFCLNWSMNSKGQIEMADHIYQWQQKKFMIFFHHFLSLFSFSSHCFVSCFFYCFVLLFV